MKLRLTTRVLLASVVGVALTAGITAGLLWANRGLLSREVRREVIALGDNSCKYVAVGVYQMLATYHQSLLNTLDRGIRVAEKTLQEAGGIRFDTEKVIWRAVNQFTGRAETVELPKMFLGQVALTGNDDPTVPQPVVDEVTKLLT